jgi:hypothetical protein
MPRCGEMRREDAYQREGHTGRTLVREEDLRIVLVASSCSASSDAAGDPSLTAFRVACETHE